MNKSKLILIDDPYVDNTGIIQFDALCPDDDEYYEASINIKNLKWKKVED